MNAKEMILKCLPKDDSLYNCRYGKVNKNVAFEIGESAWYVHGEKTVRVTVVEDINNIVKPNNELTKTFFNNGTSGNKKLANEYINSLKVLH